MRIPKTRGPAFPPIEGLKDMEGPSRGLQLAKGIQNRGDPTMDPTRADGAGRIGPNKPGDPASPDQVGEKGKAGGATGAPGAGEGQAPQEKRSVEDNLKAQEQAYDAAAGDMDRGLAAQHMTGADGRQSSTRIDIKPTDPYEEWTGEPAWKPVAKVGMGKQVAALKNEVAQAEAQNAAMGNQMADANPTLQADLNPLLEQQRRMGAGNAVDRGHGTHKALVNPEDH
jgi:hypothetical protein